VSINEPGPLSDAIDDGNAIVAGNGGAFVARVAGCAEVEPAGAGLLLESSEARYGKPMVMPSIRAIMNNRDMLRGPGSLLTADSKNPEKWT
jgi:hypothetical protein